MNPPGRTGHNKVPRKSRDNSKLNHIFKNLIKLNVVKSESFVEGLRFLPYFVNKPCLNMVNLRR